MPQVPFDVGQLMEDKPMNTLGDSTPGASQILQSAAIMHGMGRLLDSGKGAHSDTVGFRMPKRMKGFSQRGQGRRR